MSLHDSDGVTYMGSPSELDEASIRARSSVIVSRKPIMAGPRAGWYEDVTSTDCVRMPWVAQFVLRCPHCRVALWMTGRGKTSEEATLDMLSSVAAHVIACEVPRAR